MTLRLERVTYRYPGSPRDALTDVSVDWPGPGLRVVTGTLGSGCSTLLLVASGLAPRVMAGTRTGTVSVLEVDPSTSDGMRGLAGRVALLLPTPWTQLSGMTYRARDEIAFGPANLGWSRARIVDAVDRVVELLSLAHLAERDPVTLSGGELLRVILAGLLAMEPDVLLLDEPGMELDVEMAERVYGLLRELASDVSVVLASNDLDRVGLLADRLLVLAEGRALTEGPPEVALRHPPSVALGVTTTIGHVMRSGSGGVLPLDVESAVRRLRRP